MAHIKITNHELLLSLQPRKHKQLKHWSSSCVKFVSMCSDKLMSKLSSACYAIRAVKSLMTQESLRIIYFSYFHSVMTYGIIFWGNSSYCSNIFKIQKKDN